MYTNDCLQVTQKAALRMSTTPDIMESADDTSTPRGLIIGRIPSDGTRTLMHVPIYPLNSQPTQVVGPNTRRKKRPATRS